MLIKEALNNSPVCGMCQFDYQIAVIQNKLIEEPSVLARLLDQFHSTVGI